MHCLPTLAGRTVQLKLNLFDEHSIVYDWKYYPERKMYNSKLTNLEGQPQYSGHETFPLRYGWLKKAYDAVLSAKETNDSRSIFNDAGAIALFGVGKNMVNSIRNWAMQCDLIEQSSMREPVVVGNIGKLIFDSNNGLDPYKENPSSLWLLHWALATNPRLATWYWVFNHYHSDSFERDTLVTALDKFNKERGWTRVSKATVKRDVECFVRTYVAKPITSKQTYEDSIESPLTELGLIKATGKKDGFRIVRGAKPTLGMGVFAYTVIEFWNDFASANTISLEALLYQPGSPGRVFQLNEDDLIDRLMQLSKLTDGLLEWSETAGLKQLVRSKSISSDKAISFIKSDFSS